MVPDIKTLYGKLLLPRRRGGLLFVLLVLLLLLGLADTAAAALVNRKISGSMPADGDVTLFQISPDGRYAVFVADARAGGIPELFSAPIAGGPRNPLTPPLPAGTGVLGFAISPDSRQVVYWTGPLAGSADRLYSVPITGGDPAELSTTLPAGAFLSQVTITPDGQRVVYRSEKTPVSGPVDESGFLNLLSVAITGGSIVNIWGKDPIGPEPREACDPKFQMIPDSSGVVYSPYCQRCSIPVHVFRFDSGTQTTIGENACKIAVTPDGTRVVYWNFDVNALYSIPIIGGAATRISDMLAAGRSFQDFRISPDSAYVVYRADEITAGRIEVFSVPTIGGETRKPLTTGIINNGVAVESDYRITPNSQGVVYRADKEVDGRIDLFAVTMDGAASCRLNGPDGNVAKFAVTPNSQGVVFLADKDLDGNNELYSVFINCTGLRALNTPPPPTDRTVLDFQITPNNLGVIYLADQDSNEVFNLYLVSIFGGTPLPLNRPLVWGGDVSSFTITPDGMGVAYLADQETNGVVELFTTLDRHLVYLPLVLR